MDVAPITLLTVSSRDLTDIFHLEGRAWCHQHAHETIHKPFGLKHRRPHSLQTHTHHTSASSVHIRQLYAL